MNESDDLELKSFDIENACDLDDYESSDEVDIPNLFLHRNDDDSSCLDSLCSEIDKKDDSSTFHKSTSLNKILPSHSNKIHDQLHVYNQYPRYDISDLKLNDKTHQDSIPIIDSLKSTSEIILLSETFLENLDLDF